MPISAAAAGLAAKIKDPTRRAESLNKRMIMFPEIGTAFAERPFSLESISKRIIPFVWREKWDNEWIYVPFINIEKAI